MRTGSEAATVTGGPAMGLTLMLTLTLGILMGTYHELGPPLPLPLLSVVVVAGAWGSSRGAGEEDLK